jgi:hypothetical protein
MFLIDFFPNVPELIFQRSLHVRCVKSKSLVVKRQIFEFEQILNIFNFLLNGYLIFFDLIFQLSPFRQIHQVNYHFGKVMRQILFFLFTNVLRLELNLTHNFPENFVWLFTQCAFLKHFAVQFLQIHFHRIIQYIQVFHCNVDSKSSEHIVNLISGQTATAIRIKLHKNLFNWCFSGELVWKVKVWKTFWKGWLEAWTEPFDKGCSW